MGARGRRDGRLVYNGRVSAQAHGSVAEALAGLVHQFADPMACFREMVQNAADGNRLFPVASGALTLEHNPHLIDKTRYEVEHDGKRWDASQDLVGQGLGKIVSGLSGSFPTSTSFSRSAITLYAGAKTGWATVAATVVVLLVLELVGVIDIFKKVQAR